jgi:hypothetical protein
MCFKPKRAGSRKRIYSGLSPPRSFITAAMDLTVVRATERHRELVADLATERTRLREAQMVWVGRPPTANQTRLFHEMPDVVAVAKATRLRKGERTFFDLRCPLGLFGHALIRASF